MARCLNLNKSGEYALSALARLALEGGGPLTTALLAQRQRVPAAFLAKVLALCGRAGLVRLAKGPAGGVSLARGPEDITLLEIVEACGGRLAREQCVFFRERPCPGTDCEVFCPLRTEEEQTRARLAATPLSAMAAALKGHPDLRAAGT